jgi:hypothetical protein
MTVTAGSFPAGKFQIDITPQGVGLLVRVTNKNTDGWVEGKHWFSNMQVFKEKISEMAYLLGGSEHDCANVRSTVGRLASK